MQEVVKKLKNHEEFAEQNGRARQLRIDELSTQEEESKSTVNQLILHIQALPDKVNSWNVAK